MAVIKNSAEGGTNTTAVSTGNSGGASGTAWAVVSNAGSATTVFSTDYASAGSLSYKFVTSATDAQFVQWLPTASNSCAVRAYFYFPSLPTSGNGVLRVLTAGGGTTLAHVLVRNDGSFQVSDATGAYVITSSASVVPTGQWIRMEMGLTNPTTSTGTLNFALYLGDSTSAISGSTYNLTAQNLGTAAFGQVRFGRTAAFGTFATFYADGLAWQDGSSTFIGVDTNTAPTVDAGSNQNVSASATVNLSATASDTDGSVASYAWTFDYPTSGAPSLTGSTTATPSFTAGSAGALYVLKCTVTDNGGATASDTVEIRVPVTGATDMRPVAGAGTGVGTWANTGGAASEGAALADESDTTYVESPSVTGTEATRRWRLSPSATKSTAQIALRLWTDTGTANTTIRLYEGATLRQSWTQALTNTATTYTVSLSSGTVAAIGDWGNLFVEVGATT